MERLLTQQKIIQKSTNEKEAIVKASYHVAEILAKAGKSFSNGEVVKTCIMKVVEEIFPEKKSLFSGISLSRPTVTRHIEELGSNLQTQFKAADASF